MQIDIKFNADNVGITIVIVSLIAAAVLVVIFG